MEYPTQNKAAREIRCTVMKKYAYNAFAAQYSFVKRGEILKLQNEMPYPTFGLLYR
jgi:hypothetical protein